jgi:cyclase
MSVSAHPDVSVPGRLEEVADGVFACIQSDGSWMINNTGFLVAGDGVTVVDACSTERRTRAFLDTVGDVTRRPVRTLVNTHHHPDHTAGNGLFTGATIVAHENAREEMRAMGVPQNTGIWTDIEYGDLRLALPFLTFADRLTLWADELRCELRYAGQPAHTTNDIVVWIPEQSVLRVTWLADDQRLEGGRGPAWAGTSTAGTAPLTFPPRSGWPARRAR